MSFDMSQFHQVFFDETAEHLANMESLLLAIDIASPDSEDLNAIFRAAHSIKGGAATFGFADLADLTHVLENLLDKVRKHELPLSRQIVDAALQSGDLLKDMLAFHRGGVPVPGERVSVLKQALSRLAVAEVAPLAVAHAKVAAPVIQRLHIELHPPLALSTTEVWQRLAGLGALEIIAGEPATVEGGLPAIALLTTASSRDDVSEMLAFVLAPGSYRVLADITTEDDGFGLFDDVVHAPAPAADVLLEEDGFGLFAPLPPAAPVTDDSLAAVAYEEDGFGLFQPLPVSAANPVPTPAPVLVPVAANARSESRSAGTQNAESSIRVSTEKVDLLLNLVGELVITQSMLVQYGGGLDSVAHEKLLNSISLLQRNSRELQEAVMSIRMMPISFVFQRFPRVVRDLAGKLGKEVELKMVGEGTELDKGFIEKLSDPLTHLVRNSLDHGIELPQERQAKGKQACGLLTLRAFHEGGSNVIEVSDDGAGLRRERILGKARERGIAVADNMSDAEVWALIFEPGFSTAAEVTDVSGRGVGMDVVRKNIVAMGGRIDISSMPDIGTTMTIRLPLTLAIMDGMSVMVGEETYVLPLNYILESLQPRPEDVKQIVGRGRIVSIRGEYLPIISLADVFDITPQHIEPEQAILIVVEAGGQKYALMVDELLGQQQFVVKNIEANYREVDGLSGATILGDGRVALILDVGAIVRLDAPKPQPVDMVAIQA